MHLPQTRSTGLLSLLLITVIIIATGFLVVLNTIIAGTDERNRLQDRAATVAAALASDKITQLKGEANDANLPAYRELKKKLTLLKQSNTDARSIYLTGSRNDELFFYVDSEVPDTQYYSPPGEPYPEATPLFKNVFHQTQAVVEGPLRDSYGTWVSGLAPVVDLSTGVVVAVVGIDIDASTYRDIVMQAGLIPGLIATLFIVIILVFELIRRRERQQLRMRSELVSIASHELRTPVTGIRWAVESLTKTVKDATGQALVQAMHDSVLNLQAGTEDILQLTRLTSNRDKKLQLQPTNMTELITEVCDTQRLAAQEKQVVITMDNSWRPDVIVICDAVKMRRALHNVVSNAVKYSAPSSEVMVRYQRLAKQHAIIVQDHGIGIPKDEQAKVLSGFYRASNAKASVAEGTGLGLYLTKAILGQHHGSISFESEQGKGTTVTLSLPIK